MSSRRKRRSAARQGDRKRSQGQSADRPSPDAGGPAVDDRAALPHSSRRGDPSRRNKAFLAAAILLQVAWTGFLVAMALAG